MTSQETLVADPRPTATHAAGAGAGAGAQAADPLVQIRRVRKSYGATRYCVMSRSPFRPAP